MEPLTLLWAAVAALGALLLLVTLSLRRAATRLERQALRALNDATSPPNIEAEAHAWFYLRPGDAPRGPIGLTMLRAMVADGRLEADALAAPVGSHDWRPLRSVLTDVGP